jgi:hypothetical protein
MRSGEYLARNLDKVPGIALEDYGIFKRRRPNADD